MMRFIKDMVRFNTDMVRFNTNMVRFNSDMMRFIKDMVRFNADMVRFNSDIVRFNNDMVRFNSDMVRFNNDMVRFNNDMSATWGSAVHNYTHTVYSKAYFSRAIVLLNKFHEILNRKLSMVKVNQFFRIDFELENFESGVSQAQFLEKTRKSFESKNT